METLVLGFIQITHYLSIYLSLYLFMSPSMLCCSFAMLCYSMLLICLAILCYAVDSKIR